MIKTKISKDKVKFQNLYKSFFNDLKNTSCEILENKILIFESSGKNPDPASVEFEFKNDSYEIYYWDGYSLADKFVTKSYEEALKEFKKLSKKLAKNLRRF